MRPVTVFANFRIDSEERFLRMQDSFRSFSAAGIERWVINIRGPYREQAAGFLADNLGERLVLYSEDSREGWFHDSRKMLKDISTDFVFFWIEDHICVAGVEYFDLVVAEMRRLDGEYLTYTFFYEGDNARSFRILPSEAGDAIGVVKYGRSEHKRRLEHIRNTGIVTTTFVLGAPAIFKRALFESVLVTRDQLVRRNPKETPFDFEKNPRDVHWLPIRVGFTKREFFAPIDDDHGRPNHCLISRGLYPDRVTRNSILEIRESHLNRTSFFYGRMFGYYREIVNRLYVRLVFPLARRRS